MNTWDFAWQVSSMTAGTSSVRWYNVVWMEKMIGDHEGDPGPVIPFPEISAEVLKEIGIEKQKLPS